MKKLVFLIFLISQTIWAAVEVGGQAPNFKLIAEDGKEYQLNDFSGKYVVLEWFNKDCPFVRKHYDTKNMQKLQKKYTDKGVIWLAIVSSAAGKQGHINSGEATMNKVVEGSYPTHILLDPSGRVGKAYDAKTTPHMFVLNKKGQIAYMGAIDSKTSFDKADVLSADNYVDAALESMLKGKPIKVTRTRPYGCSVKY